MTTRFWLLEYCVQTLFRRKIIDLPVVDVLQTGVRHQRANNQKRITRVRKHLDDEGTRFQLALACLCLRLASLATSIIGQKNCRSRNSAVAAQAEVRVPLMVILARGDVSERAAQEVTCILQALHNDAGLTPRLGEVVTRSLTIAGQVVLRFSQYAEYPARASLMSRTYNPATYFLEALVFVFCE